MITIRATNPCGIHPYNYDHEVWIAESMLGLLEGTASRAPDKVEHRAELKRVFQPDANNHKMSLKAAARASGTARAQRVSGRPLPTLVPITLPLHSGLNLGQMRALAPVLTTVRSLQDQNPNDHVESLAEYVRDSRIYTPSDKASVAI